MLRLVYAVATLLVLLVGTGASAQTIFKREPPAGELKTGYKILVDDGRCPKGQVMEVTGGSRVHGRPGVERTRTCVPRPK